MSRLKKFRAKRYKPPTPIPPPKPPRPKLGELKRIYRDLISADVDQRVETLKKACHWYEGAIAYIIYFKALKLNQKRAVAKAQKHRVAALSTNKDESKEHAYIDAIRCYETIVQKLHPPRVNAYLSKYSKVRAVLMNRRSKYNRKFREYIDLLDHLLQPKNYDGTRIQLRVDKLSQQYRINSEGHVTFDRKFLDVARRKSRKEGLLSGYLLLFPVLAEAEAMTMEKDIKGHRTGRYVVHGSKKAKAYEDMLANLVYHCLTSKHSIRLIRRHKDAPSAKKAAA